jgi:lysyl hydroxylase/galactosyltransferase/glucosyltransferase
MMILVIHNLSHKNTPIRYITVARKPHPVLTKIKDTCHINGEELKILGWNGRSSFGIKLREINKYINRQGLGNSDIVLFTNPYDVAIVGNLKEIKQRYLTFNKPIVFGAEKECRPDKERVSQYGITFGAEFPYLNSGLFIGRVWALRQCMASYKYKENEDEQRFWTSVYFKNRSLIELDNHARLFLNCASLDEKDIDYNSHKRLMTYSKTQTHPLIIHANGRDKSFLHQFIGRWTEPSKN